MPNPVVHWEIVTPDPAKIREFYTNLYGWNVDSGMAEFQWIPGGCNGAIVSALEQALSKGTPEIFDTDQGTQFTSEAFIRLLKGTGRPDQSGWQGPLRGQHLP